MFPPNNEVDVDSRKVICTHYFVVFSSVVCNGSFLIYLSFIRFTVVVVIGQDDTEVWTTSSTTRATCITWPSGWNSKRLSLRTSVEREEVSLSGQAEETAVTPK